MILLIFFTVSNSWSQAPVDCAVEGKGWEQLVQDFVANWQSTSDFCEFKRFIALNTMISSDMRLNAGQYQTRIAELDAYGDQSEPVNYLLQAFQETWFNLFIDASLDREFNKAKNWKVGGLAATVGITVGLVSLSLALPYLKSYSSRTMRFMRSFVTGFFEKRPVVLGGTSMAKGSKISLGKKPEIMTGFVPPPMLAGSAEPADPRTLNVFMGEFYEELLASGAGVGSGWFVGHRVSLGVKKYLPKWTTAFGRAAWSQSKTADLLSPGLLAGAAVSLYVTDLAATTAANAQFQNRVETAKQNLISLAARVNEDVASKNEYDVWLHAEQLKNGLMLQNYLLTRAYTQALSDNSEETIRAILAEFSDCDKNRDEIVARHKQQFKKRIAKLMNAEDRNLKAALDITQAVQDILLNNSSPMTEPLIDTNLNLLLRDRLILNGEDLGEEMWIDVASATNDAKVECVLAIPGGYFP